MPEVRIEENGLTFNLGSAKHGPIVIVALLITAYLFLVVSTALTLTAFGSVWLIVLAVIIVTTLHILLFWLKKRGDNIIVRFVKPGNNSPARFSLEYNKETLSEGELTEERLEIRRVVAKTGKYQQVPYISNQVHLVLDQMPEQLGFRGADGIVLFERNQVEEAVKEVEKIYQLLGMVETSEPKVE